MKEIIKAKDLTVSLGGRMILDNISFTFFDGDQWAVIGGSGAGKTTLLKTLQGQQFFRGTLEIKNSRGNDPRIEMVEQQHHFKNLSNTNSFYYQQRFNSGDAEDAITVREFFTKSVPSQSERITDFQHWCDLFDIKKLYPESLIQLSNGENKRIQILKALLNSPDLLLLDNPFTGLDVASRQHLGEVLAEVAKKGIHIILVTSASTIPPFISNILCLKTRGGATSVTSAELKSTDKLPHTLPTEISQDELASLVNSAPNDFDFAVRMENVNVEYDKKILADISWEIKRGERWSLSGPNGSGKSTLLSLINADNPQAYANKVWLFDKRRGTGESIWDIKALTGYVSPELHLYFEKGISVFEVIASGLFDTIGLFKKLNENQILQVEKWLNIFRLHQLRTISLHQLSHSQQRLVLLSRALVKDPPFLIFDEPCQGLDEEQVQFFKSIIDAVCLLGDKTLIYVSHYPAEIPSCITKHFRLENGRRIL